MYGEKENKFKIKKNVCTNKSQDRELSGNFSEKKRFCTSKEKICKHKEGKFVP